MQKRILFITGTDTGIGKTFLAVRLIKQLRASGINAAGLKPICSGGRSDAKQAYDAMNGAPFTGRNQSLALQSRHRTIVGCPSGTQKGQAIRKVASHVRTMQKRFDILVVEGASGLLSPLGENFDSRDLIDGPARRTSRHRRTQPPRRHKPHPPHPRSFAKKSPRQSLRCVDAPAQTRHSS